LKKFGYNVVVLEARDRVGGRTQTIEVCPSLDVGIFV
jgi:monoamine oxidase